MEVANLVSRPIECSATTSQASLEAALSIPSPSRCLSLTSTSHGFPSGLCHPLLKRRTGSGFYFPRVVLVSSQYRQQGSAVAGDESDAYRDGGNVERSARGTSENRPSQYRNDGNGMWNRAGRLQNGRFQGEEDGWQRNTRFEGSAVARDESDAYRNGNNVKRSARGTSENRHSQYWNDGNGIWTRAGRPRNGRFQGEEDAWQRSTQFERTNVDVSEDSPKGRFAELSENQPSRLHNRFTVFERVTEPEVVPLSRKRVSTENSSASAQPDAFSRSSSSIRNTSTLSRAPPQRSASAPSLGISGGALLSSSTVDSGANPLGKDDKTGSKFTSKLQEILDNFKKKGRVQKQSVAEEGPQNNLVPQRDEPLPQRSRINAGSGFQRTNTDGMRAQHKGRLVPEHQSFTADMNKDENRYHQVAESDDEDNDVEAPFNFFSKSPAIPWESSQRPSSDSNPHTINKKRDSSTPARPLSKSIGSRSTPSRSSIPGKYSKYSKPEPKKGRIKTMASSSINLEKPSQPLPTELEATKLQGVSELGEGNDGYFDKDVSHTTFSSSGLQHSESRNAKNSRDSNLFDWSDSDSEDETDTPTAMSVSNPIAGAELPCEQEDSQLSSTEKVTTSVSTEPTDAGPLANLRVPDLPFEVQFSYSEAPNAPILGYREPQFSPFGPRTMPRPWTGGPPLKPQKKKVPEFDSFNPPPKGKKGIKPVQDPGPYPAGEGPRPAKTREEILGAPLTKEEIVMLVERCQRESRQLNLGRDGLTHNMLDLIHTHWKRRRVCKIKCKGVPTVDMDNVCFHIEDKTGGKIIYRTGGVLYLFRGRNYNYKDRPRIPIMLWKPAAPIYPKLIQQVPEGLTRDQAFKLRLLGRKVEPLCKLAKNGVYLDLVKDVRNAFKVDDLVSIDCEGLNPSDYKKIGAKLRDLVPCVLLSFKDEKILMWKGRGSDTSPVSDSNCGEAAAVLTSNHVNNISSNVVSNVESCTSNLSGSIISDKISSSSTSQLNPSRSNVEVDVSCNERSFKNTFIGASDDVDNESPCQSVGNEVELSTNERSLEHSISGASDDIGNEGQQPTCQSVGNKVELSSNERSLKDSISAASYDIGIQEQQPPCQSVSDEIVLDSSMYTKDNSLIPDGGAVQSTGLFNEAILERSLGKDELITNGFGYGEINASCVLSNSCAEDDMDRIVSTDLLPADNVLKEEKREDVLEAKYDLNIRDGTSMGEFDGALEEPPLLTYSQGEVAEESRRESLIVAGMEGLNNGLECQKDVQVGALSQLQLNNSSYSMNLRDDSVMYDSEEELRQITSSKYQLLDEDSNTMPGNQDEVQQDVFSGSELTQESEAATVRVDALWDQAVQSGMAIELDGSNLDADYVLEMANELAQSAPPGPVYTHGLIHRLLPKRTKEDSDDELNIHFGRLREKQRKQKHSRRPRAPLPTVDVPAMGGLPVDQLAKLLSPK